MERKSSFKSAMVSRLPKFGGRCSGGGTSPLSNGSAQPVTPAQDGRTSPPAACPNGAIRASPFSLKWKRDDGRSAASSASPTWPEDEDKARLSSSAKEMKNGSPATPKMKRTGSLMLAVSSPKTIPKQSLKMSPKVGSKVAQSPADAPKTGHNSSNIPAPTGSESRLIRPKLGSSSLRSSSQDSLSQSSDSLKTLPVDNMVRSNSFTHFKQIPSPTSQPMMRSFSFNRAVELAKPLANTQLRPPKSTFLRPPQLNNGRVGLGLGGLNGTLGGSGGLQCSRTPSAASSMPTLSLPATPSTPSALKKQLLPSCALTKSLGSPAGSFGYRLTRPGQVKPEQKPLFSGRVKGKGPPSVSEGGAPLAGDIEPTVDADKTDSKGDSDGSSGDVESRDGEAGLLSPGCGLAAGEPLEEMSFSSASSLDRGDAGEELLDDFYSAEDAFSDGDLPDSGNTQTPTQSQSLHSGTLDWDNMGLEGFKEESPMEDSQGPLLMSPNLSDILQASSVELSPSNSSGGTYMWDEDGLEPFIGTGTHQGGSYDNSELNSMDILNNLESPGTAELDDDDLMLDVDLPEDGLHDTDRMSNIEHLRRSSPQGQRRKYQQRSGSHHLQTDRRARVLQASDCIKASTAPQTAAADGRQPCYTPVLDELTLEYMSQDCSSLKKQLLRLKMLLQLEDPDSPPDVPVEIEDNTTASQFGELIKEVQTLRAELRSRDRTIAQLALQCRQLKHQQEPKPPQDKQSRCHCHHQRAPSSLLQGDGQMTDKRTQHHSDKATQTYWRSPSHAPPILQPFNPHLSERLQQERAVKAPPTEGRSDLRRSRPDTGSHAGADTPVGALLLDPVRLGGLISPRLHCPGAPSQQEGGEEEEEEEEEARDSPGCVAPAAMLQKSVAPRAAASTCPRLLQPLRLQKRLAPPALKPSSTAGVSPLKSGSSVAPPANPLKQLPPPSRGLPSFHAQPQVQPRGVCGPSLLQPRRTSRPPRDTRGSSSSLD